MTGAFDFAIKGRDAHTRARTGVITTPHGPIDTPAFSPVGTQATVKSLTPDQIRMAGAQLILANTYHLYLRPGAELIAQAGGIHRFMACDLPIVTDSGGFQVFSLGSAIQDGVGKIASIFPGGQAARDKPDRAEGASATFVKVEEDGVQFKSHLDGSSHYFSPEKSLHVQSLIGADFVLAFDECTSPLDSYEYTEQSMQRTHRWAVRSLEAFHRHSSSDRQALFGIVQGGAFQDLRESSARFFSQFPCFGYSIGGSLGRSKADMHRVLEWSVPLLPEGAPRHLLGIGQIEDIFECVERGIDFFDCVIPTRWARTGLALVSPATAHTVLRNDGQGDAHGAAHRKCRLNLRNARFTTDFSPLDPTCDCYTCQRFTRAYLSHLYRSNELVVYTLISMHNVYFLTKLMKDIRAAIDRGQYTNFKLEYLNPSGVPNPAPVSSLESHPT